MEHSTPLILTKLNIPSVRDDLDTAHTLVGATQNIVGDLEQPNSGLIFITPLVEVYGLNKENRR